MATTQCMYCKAKSYGPGCPFSGHGKHVHVGDFTKCVYCGSHAIGPGCLYNPFSKVHVHGIDFNQMMKDSLDSSIIGGYMIKKLSEPITETQAFKLGIVDKDGKKIKEPNTIEEKNAYTFIENYIFNIKRMLGSKIDLINSLVVLEKTQPVQPINKEEFAKQYEVEYSLKNQLDSLVCEFKKVVETALGSGISSQVVERIIIESFANKPN